MSNEFSEKLKELVRFSGIKQQSIAQVTGYDLSYVSKWMSGRMLPSEKTIETTLDAISQCIYKGAGRNITWISERYNVSTELLAPDLIKMELLDAYSKSKGAFHNLATYYASLPSKAFYNAIYEMINEADNTVLVLDLFAIDRESRQMLIGLKDGYYKSHTYDPDKKLLLIIYTESSSDVIYDAISLIHLITSFSRFDFRLINGDFANGKAIAVTRNRIISGFVVKNINKVFSASMANAVDSAIGIQDDFLRAVQDNGLVFAKKNMASFTNGKDYLKSMLSTNIKWIQGHITELIMPDELFEILLRSIDNISADEARRIHVFSKNIIEQDTTNVLIYESALSDLVATGEVDFYNNRIILSSKEIEAYIVFLMNIIKTCNIQMITAPLFTEFRHAFSPCLYISDSICYLRTENSYESDNIFEIVDREVGILFDRFYSDVMEKRKDAIVQDKNIIQKRLEHYKGMARLTNA